MRSSNQSSFCFQQAGFLGILAMLLLPLSSTAQTFTPNFGYSPTLLAVPDLGNGTQDYRIDATSECPVPSIAITGYGGEGNNSAEAYTGGNRRDNPYGSASTGVTNYGIAAGLRIPIGGRLSEFCKDYAKAKADFQRTRAINKERDSQMLLIQQCDFLVRYNWDLNNPGFEDKAFSHLLPCRKIMSARKPDSVGVMQSPPVSPTETFSPEVPVSIERREVIRRNSN